MGAVKRKHYYINVVLTVERFKKLPCVITTDNEKIEHFICSSTLMVQEHSSPLATAYILVKWYSNIYIISY